VAVDSLPIDLLGTVEDWQLLRLKANSQSSQGNRMQ
jgi:hypothetical protein